MRVCVRARVRARAESMWTWMRTRAFVARASAFAAPLQTHIEACTCVRAALPRLRGIVGAHLRTRLMHSPPAIGGGRWVDCNDGEAPPHVLKRVAWLAVDGEVGTKQRASEELYHGAHC